MTRPSHLDVKHRSRTGSAIRRRSIALARRSIALAVLVALLCGLPLMMARVIGTPYPSVAQLRDLWRTGRLGDDTLVRIGGGLFMVLWIWFSATAMGEMLRVLRWRTTPGSAPLPPPNASPSGWIRRLVRVALISATALTMSGFGPVISSGSTSFASTTAWSLPRAAAVQQPTSLLTEVDTSTGPADGRTEVVSRGRDTPYSIASRLGDPLLRDRIIEMNRGATTPNGATWNGGVFPAGMNVTIPAVSPAAPLPVWSTHVVRDGDSVFGIAAELTDGDRRSIGSVADQIIERNLGHRMNDGHVFDDPSLIRSGWILDVPDRSTPADSTAPDSTTPDSTTPDSTTPDSTMTTHVVVPGDSYWRIAEQHLRASSPEGVTPAAVAEATADLVDLNALRLGHRNPTLLVPGEIVRWADTPQESPPPKPVAVPLPAVTPPVAVPLPAVTLPVLTLPAVTLPVHTLPAVTLPASTSTPPRPAPAPGPASTPAPAPTPVPVPVEVVADNAETSTTPRNVGIGAALLLCAGALGLLETRRREQLRGASVSSRLPVPPEREVRAERVLRSLNATDRVLRIDLALRAAAVHLIGEGRHVLGVLLGDTGELTLLLDGPAPLPPPPWKSLAGGARWRLAATVDNTELARDARRSGAPCPALVHLGPALERGVPVGALFIDLEALGLLCVVGPPGQQRRMLNALVATLSTTPLSETLHVITSGIDEVTHLGNPNAESAESLDAAIDAAAATLGSMPTLVGLHRTFALRVAANETNTEAWEPAVVVVTAADISDELASDVVQLTGGGGRGLAVVVDRLLPGARWTLTQTGESGLWHFAPLGLDVEPVGLTDEEMTDVSDLLEAAQQPLTVHPVPEPADQPFTEQPFTEQPWALMIRVLGGVSVVDRSGAAVEFGRSKALELAIWLGLHRERSTRTAARTALWDLDVRPPTFANVVSDARRTMARLVAPPEGEEWIERTLTEQLPLHCAVVTDAELLQARLEHARRLSPAEAIDVVRPGLELVTDLPFAGTSYLWPDAEGITSSLTLLATGAAAELARYYQATGDIDGVFWATGQGLKVLSGHEELIALRMRAHAHRGDLAGVRSEWEVYERALHADPWSSAEPSPKLVAVRRELLSTS